MIYLLNVGIPNVVKDGVVKSGQWLPVKMLFCSCRF